MTQRWSPQIAGLPLYALVAFCGVAQAADFVEVEVVSVRPGPDGEAHALLLRSKEKAPREVTIWIGPFEAMAIQLRLQGRRYPRPLTHDLLQTILDKVQGEVVRVDVRDVRMDTFLGRIHLSHAGKTHIIDARPSDSVALALGAQAPIFVSEGVFKKNAEAKAERRSLVRPPPSTKL